MIATEIDFNVLVIEDNHRDFETIENFLSEGFASPGVFRSNSFFDAKELVRSGAKIDIILLDLQLPELDNLQLTDALKSLAGGIPVIALTGNDKSYSTDMLAAGVSDYLIKDELTPFQLYKSITYCLERDKYLRKLKESEEKYKKIFQYGPLPKWIYDRKTLAFLDVNEAAIEHYGYTREEFLSMTIADIRPKTELGNFKKAIESVTETTLVNRGIYKHSKKDGTVIDVHVDGNEITFQGKTARLVVSHDITSKLLSERALEESERRFKYVVQEGGDLIVIMAPNGDFQYVSPNHAAIVGYTYKQLVGKNILKFIHRDDRLTTVQLFRELRKSRQITTKPFRFCHANGSYVWFESIASNSIGDGIIDGFLINSRDVTARVENEQQIREANERFEAVAKATSDAIYSFDFETGKIHISGSTTTRCSDISLKMTPPISIFIFHACIRKILKEC